jgi:hypothetical protein
MLSKMTTKADVRTNCPKTPVKWGRWGIYAAFDLSSELFWLQTAVQEKSLFWFSACPLRMHRARLVVGFVSVECFAFSTLFIVARDEHCNQKMLRPISISRRGSVSL